MGDFRLTIRRASARVARGRPCSRWRYRRGRILRCAAWGTWVRRCLEFCAERRPRAFKITRRGPGGITLVGFFIARLRVIPAEHSESRDLGATPHALQHGREAGVSARPRRGPGSAPHHYVLHRARDDRWRASCSDVLTRLPLCHPDDRREEGSRERRAGCGDAAAL